MRTSFSLHYLSTTLNSASLTGSCCIKMYFADEILNIVLCCSLCCANESIYTGKSFSPTTCSSLYVTVVRVDIFANPQPCSSYHQRSPCVKQTWNV
ncbi:hypothetical protein F4777DRAFT_2589 [Nemania sp. FL0916]|nr:hypothetical protein F4777DRAFT_2589 [Nemania sp. FL0916]